MTCLLSKNTQMSKSSDLCLLSCLSWVPLHGSEVFVFFVLAGLPKTDQKQKKTKSSDHLCLLSSLSWVPLHGSEFVGFCNVFFGFFVYLFLFWCWRSQGFGLILEYD